MIRRATPADAETLLPLIRDHARFERASADCSLEGLQAVLRAPSRLLAWLAFERDGAVGYATATVDVATWSARPFLHLDCLFVADEFRSRGVGLALMKQAAAEGAATGCTHMEWQTPSWNAAAVRFYRRQGARGLAKLRFRLDVAGFAAAADQLGVEHHRPARAVTRVVG